MRRSAAFILLAFGILSQTAAAFDGKLVALGGPADREDVRRHAAFALDLGFDGFYVGAGEAGWWTSWRAPKGPEVDAAFAAFARAAVARGVRIVVSVNPVAESRGQFVFSERDGAKRLAAFLKRLHRDAGIEEFVLAFDDQPSRLTELRDVLRYGKSAAPAHLELAATVASRRPRGTRLWLLATAYCDRHIDDPGSAYARAFLEGLSALPPDLGIVWTGPEVVSRVIRAEDLRATRARLGGRPLMLYDNYPVNDDPGDALGLVLGPLRHRDGGLDGVASVYLSCPMTQLGASRLPLMTVADYLRDPEGYEPDRSWRRALDALAPGDPEAREALETQAMEWGGWIGELNYRHHDEDNAYAVGAALDDPAAVASMTWTVERYPSRMEALRRLPDAAFRDDVLAVMGRRLAIARIVPLAVEYRARVAAGRADARVVLDAIMAERAAAARTLPEAPRVVDIFLEAAGIPGPDPGAGAIRP